MFVTHPEQRLFVGAPLDLGEKLGKFLLGSQDNSPMNNGLGTIVANFQEMPGLFAKWRELFGGWSMENRA